MNKKNALTKLCISVFAVLVALVCLAGCSKSEETNEAVVYKDMQSDYESSGLASSNIGIVTKTESDGEISYGNFGSGVVFEKDAAYYYAFTAAHVVDTKTGSLLIFTVNTDMEAEDIPGMEDEAVLSQDVYETMVSAETVYSSSQNDVAIVRFKTDEKLACVELADSDPKVDDRILCVGNPENDWFAISCGKITGEVEEFGELNGYPTTGMKHSAYIQKGSSGGAALSEKMTLVGITPGAGLSLDGSTFEYGVLIPASELQECLNDWKN